MKYHLVFAILVATLLAGCGADEAPQPDSGALHGGDEAATAEEAAPPAPPPTDSDEAPTLVEESAADVQETDPQDVELMLAPAGDTVARANWKYREGEHFTRLVPTQPTVGGADKVEVAEVFWYGCNHCYDFEIHVKKWLEAKPANARFVRIPAVWNPLVKLHAQLYYTEEVLGKNGKIADPEAFRAAVFREYHQRGNRLATEDAILAVFQRFGVSEEDFRKAWGSFEVAQKLRVAQDLARRYGISSVPAIVVNGKYRTGASEAGSYPKLLELMNELVARETVR